MTTALRAIAPIAFMFASAAAAQTAAPVTDAEIREHIAVLASDEYGGRRPGTPGETLTAHYIATQLHRAGFGPAGEGAAGWYQAVPLVEMAVQSSQITIERGSAAPVALTGELSLRSGRGQTSIAGALLRFVGYGPGSASASVAGVRGAVVLMAINPQTAGDPAWDINARRDALVAAGARAVLIVTPPGMFAGVSRGFNTPRPNIETRMSRAELDGILSYEAASALFEASGMVWLEALRAAAEEGYAGATLDIAAELRTDTRVRRYNSYNVTARLRGRRPDEGTVLLTGHWDHLGECRAAGAEDRICNGAVDNASGIAVLIETAERVAAGRRLDRDVMIVATTAEEMGLLGAYQFVAQPIVPLADIQVVLNVDTVAIASRGASVAIVGRGTTPFDPIVERAAAALGRTIDGTEAANAFIRRQDGWAFTQAGVPALMAGGSFSDATLLQAFLGGDYHGPNDELDDDLPLGGAAEDADLHVALVRVFADSAASPRRVAR